MAKILHRKGLAFGAAATATFILAPASAEAQSLAASGPAAWAKTDAILSGAPSALEATLAQQSGYSAPTFRAPLRPAAYAQPPIASAVLRSVPSAGVLSGRPDVFGTVALRVGHTPLDARWKRVEHSSVDGTAAVFAEGQRGKDAVKRLEAVNWYVNKRVRFVDDQRRWGRADVWSAANETLNSGKGDCEDYAIAKLAMLRRAGISDRDLYVVILRDLVRRADHAVLVVRAAGHMYLLDNGTDELLDSESVRDYRPIFTFAASGTWTHGYRVRPETLNIASAEGSSKPTLVAAADQRSWSASLLAFNTGFNK